MQTLTLPPHKDAPLAKVAHREVFTWKEGTFIENIAIDKKGDIFVSDYPNGIVFRIHAGIATTHCTLPTKIAGLAFDAEENLFVTGGETGVAPGMVFKVTPDGQFRKWLDIPGASFLNGITPLHGSSLLTVDSLNGSIYAISTAQPSAELWFQHDLFLPNPALANFPGINGIKKYGSGLYVSNTAYGKIYRIELDKKAAPIKVTEIAGDLCCDDLAIDAEGNLYLTSHMHNSLVKLSINGDRSTLAGPEEGMVGSTACAFGRTNSDAHTLYVVTEGGVAVPYHGMVQKAKLVSLAVGHTGAPLL